MAVNKTTKIETDATPTSAEEGSLSRDARRVLAVFRERSCHVVGRGLLWQVIATAAFVQRFDKEAGISELVHRGLVALSRGHRYVLTAAGETYLRATA